ncbi:MAG: putative transporter ATP-binding protein [Burkholderiales bacterium]|jgi:ATP-binding cassette subfamily B protein|nr:putative transporter ATP-binding protein [Burkholderiales bacterium]
MKQVFSFLWRSIQQYRIYYLIMIAAPILGAFYRPVVYYAIKMMVDIIDKAKDLSFSQLLKPLIIYILADVLLSTMWRLSNVAAWKSEPYVERNILLKGFGTLLSYRYSFFQNVTGGSLVSKIKGLLEGYQELWSQLWYGILFWLLSSITTGVSIIFINFTLGSIVIIWALLFIILNYFFAKKINVLSQFASDAKHKVIGEISDNIANVQSIKLFASRNYEYNRLQNNIDRDFIPKTIKLGKTQTIIDVINDSIGILFMVIMIIIMIELKRLNQITIGDFVFVFTMMFQFQENVWHLVQEFHKLSNKMGDLRSSLSIYTADKSEYQQNNYPPVSQHDQFVANNLAAKSIEFKNIHFTYNNERTIFSGLNLSIKPEERIGIIGFTGAGKTTLINLLLKVFLPENGSILIDGTDISDIDCDSLRQQIAVIPQDISLFHRTLMENIRYSRPTATDEEVINACISAHADEFINKLPDKYNTMVGERGVKLSGGQHQRIAIARAILKNAPILVLDEATSSLDSVTEQYIQQSIDGLLAGKTVLAIAHRLSTLKNMDRLIVIDQGKIVDMGTHDELVAKADSLYAKIWHTQHLAIT